jgi:hypothetical protein
MDVNYNMTELLEIVSLENNLDFLNNIKITKNSRERQDSLNRASKKCRDKKKQLFILMKNHIERLHNMLINNNDNNIIIMINNYNEDVEKIKNKV